MLRPYFTQCVREEAAEAVEKGAVTAAQSGERARKSRASEIKRLLHTLDNARHIHKYYAARVGFCTPRVRCFLAHALSSFSRRSRIVTQCAMLAGVFDVQ